MKKVMLMAVAVVVLLSSGCTVIAVADAVVSTAVDVAAIAVKGTVAVVDAAIPDADDESEDG